MKQKAKKIISLMVALATVVGAYSYASTKAFVATWVFVGDELSDVANITAQNYVKNPQNLPEGCDEGEDLPCQYFLDDSIEDIDDLETYLHSEFGTTAPEIADGANTMRPTP